MNKAKGAAAEERKKASEQNASVKKAAEEKAVAVQAAAKQEATQAAEVAKKTVQAQVTKNIMPEMLKLTNLQNELLETSVNLKGNLKKIGEIITQLEPATAKVKDGAGGK